MQPIRAVRRRRMTPVVLVSLVALLPSWARSASAETDAAAVRAVLTGPAPSALELQAAGIVVSCWAKMYGARLPINPPDSDPATDGNVILVGRSAAVAAGMAAAGDLEKVKYDGFVLTVRAGKIALAGYRDCGTIYAAYDLFERLGCRFYSATADSFPKAATTAIADMRISDKPFFEYRHGSNWALRQSVGDIGDPTQALDPELFTARAGSDMWFDQTSGYLVPKALYYDAHPEYYAINRRGERMPKTARNSLLAICVSNAGARRIAAERAVAWVRAQPDKRFFIVTPTVNNGWCQCPGCLALDAVKGRYSDRLLHWANEIARAVGREFPDVRLITYCFGGTEAAPVREKPEKNLYFFHSPAWGMSPNMSEPVTGPGNAEALAAFAAWRAAAPDNLGVTDYNHWLAPYRDVFADDVRWYARQGVKGLFFRRPPVWFADLHHYVTAKLLWNPDADVEALTERFVADNYGPAARNVTAYLKFMRASLPGGTATGPWNGTMPPAYFRPHVIRRSLEMFDTMLKSAAKDAASLKRLERERTLFIGSALASVNMAEPGVAGEEERARMELFGAYLAGVSAQWKALDKAPATDATRSQKDALLKSLRGRLDAFAGTRIPDQADAMALAEEFRRDPAAFRIAYPAPSLKTAAEVSRDGVRLPATAFEGGLGPMEYGWLCPKKTGVAVYGGRSGRPSVMWAEFSLATAPAGGATLEIEGQDWERDDAPSAPIRIRINGATLFEGPNGFAKQGWSSRTFALPAGLLRAGKNRLEIANLSGSAWMYDRWFFLSDAEIGWRNGG